MSNRPNNMEMTVYFKDRTLKQWIVEQAEAAGVSMSKWVERALLDERQCLVDSTLFIEIKTNRPLRATTAHSASSYGLPVLRDEKGKAYGIRDIGPVRPTDRTDPEVIRDVRRAGYQVQSKLEAVL